MTERTCGLCGSSIGKASAYLNGQPVCDTCYHREFKGAACVSCGANYRRHISDNSTTQCRKCRPKEHCIRCRKITNNHSFRTPNGPVCSYCRRFFKEPGLCTNCGKRHRHLAKHLALGFDTPVCPACRSQHFEICARCSRPKKVAARRSNGQPLCAACKEDKPFVCPICKEVGRPHSKLKCKTCYSREYALRFASKLTAQLNQQWLKNDWEDFVQQWVPNAHTSGTLNLPLTRTFAFFKKLDGLLHTPAELAIERLIELLGPNSLNTYSTGYNFYIENKRISPVSLEFLEAHRGAIEQTKLLARVSPPWKQQLLQRYLRHLAAVSQAWRKRGWVGKHERHAPRTVTLLLRAAWKFIEFLPEDVCSVQAIGSESLDRFVVYKPGHKNALHSFINYLNRSENLFQKLVLTGTRKAENKTDYILPEHQSDVLLKQWLNPSDKELRNTLIGLFMLVYARTAKQVVRLCRGDFIVTRDGVVTVRFGKTPITLDESIAVLLIRYLDALERRRGSPLATDDFIFPGRVAHRHLSPESITYALAPYKVTAEQLFSTALANCYRNGLTKPKVLVRTLGISLLTALDYWELFAPRVTEEMAQNAGKR